MPKSGTYSLNSAASSLPLTENDSTSNSVRKRNNTDHDGATYDDIPMSVVNPSVGDYDVENDARIRKDSDYTDEEPNLFMAFIGRLQDTTAEIYSNNKQAVKALFVVLLLLGWHGFVGLAIWRSFNDALLIFVLTILVWLGIFYWMVFLPYFGEQVNNACFAPLSEAFFRAWSHTLVKVIVYLSLIAALVVFLAIDTKTNRQRLVSLGGLCVYLFLLFIFSTNPARVRWRPVIWGLILQFVFGLITLRWSVGETAFLWVSDKITGFLNFVGAGTSFVYGYLAEPTDAMQALGFNGVFAFATLPVAFFFSAFISVLYYLQVMQFVIFRIGWVMSKTLGTTAAESMNAAGNIFILGMTESPLTIRPYLAKLTHSEMHAVMCGGFATIAGTVFAAYVSFGACASHLLSASIMSAPAALAVSKLFYPETEKSKNKTIDDLKLDPPKEKNVLEAASSGAVTAIFLVECIIANLIVFLSFLSLANYLLTYLGGMVGIQCLTFEKLLSWVFFPFAYIMGASTDPQEVLTVAELMGIKTFINEFVAYQRLGKLVQCGKISQRAKLVATYALCGFSNIGSIGIQIGGLSAMCPQQRPVIARVAVRALIAGSCVCFMTACIAGILSEDVTPCPGPSIPLVANCTAYFSDAVCGQY